MANESPNSEKVVRFGRNDQKETVSQRDSEPKAEDPDEPLFSVKFGPGGTKEKIPLTRKDLEQLATAKARQMFHEELEKRLGESTSPAASWLKQYRAQHQNYVQSVTFEEDETAQTFFVKCFSDAEVVELGVMMARSGHSLLTLEDLEAQHIFNMALLTIGVSGDPLGQSRFFAEGEAQMFYESRGEAMEVSGGLRSAILQLNPAIAKKNGLSA